MVKFLSSSIVAAMAAAVSLSLATPDVSAGQRYATPPPLVVSPDVSGPLMLQLRGSARTASSNQLVASQQFTTTRATRVHKERTKARKKRENTGLFSRLFSKRKDKSTTRTASRTRSADRKISSGRRGFDPALLPRVVRYKTKEKPGTVIVNTAERRLYLVMENGKARRYGVGVGRPGFTWSGVNRISRKAEWPGWTPPAAMRARERKKGNILPKYMPGGINNPLGARALYIGSTIYRLHGSNQEWSIGKAVSSGCIRLRNKDVVDLYERVKVGSKVIVL